MYNLHSWNSFCSFTSLNIVLIYGYDRLRWASFFSPYFRKHSLAYIAQTLFRCHSNPYCWLSFFEKPEAVTSSKLCNLFFFAAEGPIPSKHHVVAKVKGIRFVIIFDKRHSCCVPQLWDLVSVGNIVCWPSVPKYMIGQKRLDGIDWEIWMGISIGFCPQRWDLILLTDEVRNVGLFTLKSRGQVETLWMSSSSSSSSTWS